MTDNQSTMTPGELASRLQVQERTLRRFSAAYEAVHGPLPRDAKGHRIFPADAVMRLSGAVPVLRERPAVGLEAVLRGQVTGTTAPTTPAPDMQRVDVLDVLESLRLEVQRLSREIAELRDHMQTRPDNRPDTPIAGHPDTRTPNGQPDDRMTEELASDHADAPAPTAPAATAPDADQLRDLEVGTSLRVASTTLPSRLKNDLRWSADRYVALEATLRGTQAVTLHRTNGKVSWRTDSGDNMRPETVRRLLASGVLQMG